jgi:hypothetical protein
MAKAVAHVADMSADMRCTEILKALESRVFAATLFPEHARQVFLLTDGEVSNTDAVIAAVRKVAATTRVFAFGIGNGASRALVNGVARAGRGEAEFIAEGEAIAPKIMRQLKRAVQPSLRDVRVDWIAQGTVLAAEAAPWVPPPIFSGERFVSFAFFGAGTVLPDEVAVSGISPTGRIEAVLKVPFEAARRGDIVHRMAAKERIRELQEGGTGAVAPYARAPRIGGSKQERRTSGGFFSRIFGTGRRSTADAQLASTEEEEMTRAATNTLTEDQIKTRVIELGVKYSLATRHTSFVAIEYRENKVSSELMELRAVPVNTHEDELELQQAKMDMHLAGAIQCSYLSAPPDVHRKSKKKSSSLFSGFSLSRKSSAPAPAPASAPASAPSAASRRRASPSGPQLESLSVVRDECLEEEREMDDHDGCGASPPPPPPPACSSAPGGGIAPPSPPSPKKERFEEKKNKSKESARSTSTSTSKPMRPSRPDSLIMLQGFDGSWKMTGPLAASMGLTLADLEGLAQTLGASTSDTSILATAIAVAWLAKHYAALKDEWDLLVQKAKGWLAAKGFPNLETQVNLS